MPDELRRRGLFEIRGRARTEPTEFRQPTAHYIEQFHSTASLARELMSPGEAADFDANVRAGVRDFENHAGELTLEITTSVVWGRPRSPERKPEREPQREPEREMD